MSGLTGPVVPEICRLVLPSRGAEKFFEGNELADQRIADFERLEHEVAVLREENAELRCRVGELEAEAMEAAGNYRQPVAQSIVRGVS